MKFRTVMLILIALALGAYLTKPRAADVETALRGALYERLLTTEVDAGREILGNAMLVACRIDPSTCFEFLRQGLEVTYEDRVVYARVTVRGFGRSARCTGAFTRFWCPGGFAADS